MDLAEEEDAAAAGRRRGRAVAAIADGLEQAGATVLSLRDPVVLAKALKHPAEVAGHRAASVRDGAALTRFLRWCKLTLPGGGETELGAATDELLARPTAWVLGSEAHGVPDDVAAAADARVRVPIRGRAESLNLATAAAVCLYASVWAQEGPPASR